MLADTKKQVVLKMRPNCPDVEEDVYSSARALQCPVYQESDTQYEYKEKHKHGKLVSGRPGHYQEAEMVARKFL